MKQILTIFLILFLVSSCNTKKDEFENTSFTDQQLFKEGHTQYLKGNYSEANKYFTRLTQEYPYSEHASESQFLEGMSHFRRAEYDDAVIAFDEFISLYPTSEQIENVYYMRALSYYDQISEVRLDQSIAVKAEGALKDIINRFPSSKYAKDAKLKLDLVYDQLAGKEMYIGRFYLKKGDIISAITRFQNVVNSYQNTSSIEEALYRLVACYYALGVKDEAIRNGAVLGNNYPSSKWYKYSYNILNNAH
jgi:outer membrane protein assembly factor BamD